MVGGGVGWVGCRGRRELAHLTLIHHWLHAAVRQEPLEVFLRFTKHPGIYRGGEWGLTYGRTRVSERIK